MLNNTQTEYGVVTKTLHWLIAALIIGLLAVGLYMADLDKEDPLRRSLFAFHKATGALTLMLVVLRLVWLRISPAPALPAVFEGKEKMVITGVKGVLYLLMVLIPVSGYVMSTAKGFPVNFYGLFDLPTLLSKSPGLGEFAEGAHEVLAWGIMAFIALHLAGAAKHRLKDKGGETDILKRML